ncbi:MAG: GIY-YIG nuclease family protein, partial [Planctomycetaceae bacterium]|nr:GIY-YIG nuclease family protein [Planctomycetaceae bacterium]
MKLYAYSTPDIEKHAGYLKIGETHGNVDKRVQQQGHELNLHLEIVWRDAVYTELYGIDKRIHRHLKNKGFQVQQFADTGRDTEWVKCSVADVEKAFQVIKAEQEEDEKQRQTLGEKFFLEIRNWYYWATENRYDAETSLRHVVRLLFCF